MDNKPFEFSIIMSLNMQYYRDLCSCVDKMRSREGGAWFPAVCNVSHVSSTTTLCFLSKAHFYKPIFFVETVTLMLAQA
jgi:hypothetical protein